MKRLIFSILLFPALLFGQELDATVNVNYEQLSSKSKERLENFGQQISDYLNNTKFTEKTWEYERIKCSFNIFFTGGSEDMNYRAQVVINSLRPVYNSLNSALMLSLKDDQWDFTYEKNQAMYFDPITFNPLTSFLDFYAYVILGFDADSYGPNPYQGSDYFNRAYEIAIRGATSRFSEAWQSSSSSYSRRALLDDILNAKFQQFRHEFMEYHFNGLDLVYQNKNAAVKKLVNMINYINDNRDKLNSRSVLLKVFFDSKNREIIDVLKNYEDKSIYEKLKRIDPGNTTRYNEALK